MKPSMNLIKEKMMLPPPLPQVTLPNPFHPTCIWETISLMLSVRSSLKAPHSLRKIQRNQRETVATKGKLSPKVANMGFECFYLLIVENNWLLKFLDNTLFLDILDIIFWIWFKISLILIFKLWEWWWDPQGGMCLID